MTTNTQDPNARSSKEAKMMIIRIVLISFVLFFNALTSSFSEAFFPDVMVKFGAAKDKTESGKAAAWITAGFCLGRSISASMWGIFIDKYGRKAGLLIILTNLTLCTIALGFCQSYYAIIAVRFITGLLNGLNTVGKTISLEVCTDDDLKAWAISVTNSIWSLAGLCGPIFGALLYMHFETYPILASSLGVAILGVTLIILCWYLIDETLPPGKYNKVEPKKSNKEDNNLGETKVVEEEEEEKWFSNQNNVGKIISIFSFNTFFASVFSGLVIYWSSAKYEDGGLNFGPKDISNIFMYFTVPQLLMQTVAYPLIQKRLGDYWMLNVGHLLHLPVFILLPFAHSFGNGAFKAQQLWIVLWLFLRNMASLFNFSALQRFTNDVVPPNRRGIVNGIQVTCSSGLQVTAPFIGQWLVSWSMTNGLAFPFDYHFVFILMCCITVVVLIIIRSLRFADIRKTKLIGSAAFH